MDGRNSGSHQPNGVNHSTDTHANQPPVPSVTEKGEMEEKKTRWGSIWLASVILFLVALQFSIYLSSLWPYLSQIDKTADETFYGFILAAWSGGQMIASPLFGWWNVRIKKARFVIGTGVVFSIIGNLVYIFTEATVQGQRKWMIFAGRLLCGVAGGIAGTVRGYVATASVPKDQHRAVSIGTVAWSLGIAAGPLVQAIVTPIGYPGYSTGPLHFNTYTASAFISIAAALILLVLLITVFKENYVGIDVRKEKDPFHFVPKADLRAAILLMMAWFAAFFMLTNSDTVESPYTMSVFDWTNDEAVLYNSIIMGVSCVISFVIYVIYILLGKRINERISIIFGLTLLFAFYAITFSWSFYTEPLDLKITDDHTATTSLYTNMSTTMSPNATTAAPKKEQVGCDAKMEWCHYTPRLPLAVYLVAYPCFSIGFPMCNVAILTLFAKVLGPRRQGFMQSMMVMSGSTARTIGPIIISWLFSSYGPRVSWVLTSVVIAISLISIVVGYEILVPLKMRPKMRFGEKLRYDGGRLYRF